MDGVIGMRKEDARIKEELILTLTAELPVLRARLGISQEAMGNSIGISRQTYSGIETGVRRMSWTTFMALIAVFDLNEATSLMLDQLPEFIQKIRMLTVQQVFSADINDVGRKEYTTN